MIIGVSELQKNISIFKNLTESVQIVDKKTKEVLALVLLFLKIHATKDKQNTFYTPYKSKI